MMKAWGRHKLTPIITEGKPERSRAGVYKARERGKPPRTPMFWSWWDGRVWGPVVRSKADAQEAYAEERRKYGPAWDLRQCDFQGIMK